VTKEMKPAFTKELTLCYVTARSKPYKIYQQIF